MELDEAAVRTYGGNYMIAQLHMERSVLSVGAQH
jgi:hypothetical protein